MNDYIFIKSKYSHNFGNIKNSPEYDDNVYKQFINSQDLYNAAEYLNQFYFPNDPDKEFKKRCRVNSLRQQADKTKSLTVNMTDDQRDAFAFNYAMENNLPLPIESTVKNKNNEYTKRYREAVSNLFGDESKDIVIDIKNDNQNRFWGGLYEMLGGDSEKATDVYYEALGFGKGNYRNGLTNLGACVTEVNGVTSIRFSKSNPNFLKFLQAYKQVNSGLISMHGIAIDENGKEHLKGNYDAVSLQSTTGSGATLGERTARSSFNEGYTSENLINHTKTHHKGAFDYIDELSNVVSEAKNISNPEKILSNKDKEKRQKDIMVTPYMSAQHAMLEEYHDLQLIDDTYYTKKKQEMDDEVLRLLQTDTFKDRYVYINAADDNVLDEVYGTDNRQWVSSLINTAIQKGQKLQISEATMGGVLGTYVVIPAFVENKELNGVRIDYDTNTGTASDAYHGNENKLKEYRIFLPNFLGGEAEEEIYRDPKNRATRQLENIDDYKYDYELSDKRTVRSLGDGTYQITRHEGFAGTKGGVYHPYGTVVEIKTKQEMQNILAQEMAAEDIAANIKMAASDNEGNINNNLLKSYLLNNSQYIKKKVAQLYGLTEEQFLSEYGNEFLKVLSNLLGININSL